jgi:hypothetical protein
MRTDGRTDLRKLMVALRNFANALWNGQYDKVHWLGQWVERKQCETCKPKWACDISRCQVAEDNRLHTLDGLEYESNRSLAIMLEQLIASQRRVNKSRFEVLTGRCCWRLSACMLRLLSITTRHEVTSLKIWIIRSYTNFVCQFCNVCPRVTSRTAENIFVNIWYWRVLPKYIYVMVTGIVG